MRAALLLAAALAAVAWFAWGDIPWMPRHAADTRVKMFRRWLVKDALGVLLPALVGLAAMGRLGAIGHVPPELLPLRAWLPVASVGVWPLLIGAVLGTAIGFALAWRAGRRGRRVFTLGEVDAVMAHDRDEMPYGVAMALMAGVAEELFHRLLMPLLIAGVTGSAVVGAGVALVLVAAMHRYQGWTGVAATGVVGALFQALYLNLGSLWPVMLFHILIDLNGAVLRPLVVRRARGYAARASGEKL